MASANSRPLQVVVYNEQKRKQEAAKEATVQKLDLQKDVQAFLDKDTGIYLLPRTWNRASIVKDFTEASNFPALAKTVIGGAIKKINAITTPDASGAASNLLEKVAHYAQDGTYEIIGMAVQKEHESKADGNLARSLGKQFVLLSTTLAKGAIAGLPGAIASTLFTIIVYLHEKGEEKQKKWNAELATILDQKLEKIRQDVNDKMAANSRKRVERMLMSGFATDVFDNTVYGFYEWTDERAVEWRNSHLIQMHENVQANIDIYITPSDLLWAAGIGKLLPGNKLTEKQIDDMNEYLKEQVYDKVD